MARRLAAKTDTRFVPKELGEVRLLLVTGDGTLTSRERDPAIVLLPRDFDRQLPNRALRRSSHELHHLPSGLRYVDRPFNFECKPAKVQLNARKNFAVQLSLLDYRIFDLLVRHPDQQSDG